jgi:hypothetical protein
MFVHAHKFYFFIALFSFSHLVAQKIDPLLEKQLIQHKTTLQKKKYLNLRSIPKETRYKLLITAYNLKDWQMYQVYLDDWAIRQCNTSNYIGNMIGRPITLNDIEKHLQQAKKCMFPGAIYYAIGKKIADIYLFPHINNQVKNSTKQRQRALNNLRKNINQSIAIVLIYAYDAHNKGQAPLEFPHHSNTEKILNRLHPKIQTMLGDYFNFKIV